MAVFGRAVRLASWAGVCPGNHESAGRRRKGTTRRGNVHLRTALVAAAKGPIQDLLGARRPPPGRENVGRRVTGRRWWPILPSGGRTEVGTNQVIGSRIQDRPAPRSGITECRGPSRASTWGSFCLRFAALRPPPALGGGHGSS